MEIRKALRLLLSDVQLLSGIDCGGRGTSCPDQLAKALQEYKNSASAQEV